MKNLLRILTILLPILGAISTLLDFNGNDIEVFRSEELRQLSKASNEPLSELLSENVFFWGALVFLEAISLIGLFLYWRPARYLFIFVILATYLVAPPLTNNYNILGNMFEISFVAIEILIIVISFIQPNRDIFIQNKSNV